MIMAERGGLLEASRFLGPWNARKMSPLAFIAQVYDASNTYLTYGGPWACAANTGTVSDHSHRTGGKIVLFAEDQAGAFVYRGEKNEINIEEAAITDAGDITTYSFVTAVKEPYYEPSARISFINWHGITLPVQHVIKSKLRTISNLQTLLSLKSIKDRHTNLTIWNPASLIIGGCSASIYTPIRELLRIQASLNPVQP